MQLLMLLLHLLALQLKSSLSGLRAPGRLFFTHPTDARDGILICRGVLIAPPFIGLSVDAQSTTQPWRADPVTLDRTCKT